MQENIILLGDSIKDINYYLNSLQNFICQFNEVKASFKVGVYVDAYGSMDMDFPHNMSDKQIFEIRNRIGVLDRLINTQGSEAKIRIEKALDIYTNIKNQNPEFKSEILNQVSRFKKLNESYAY